MNDDTHECPYKNCERRVSWRYLACRAHWMKVPRELRELIYATVHADDPGPYLEARREAIEEMNKR